MQHFLRFFLLLSLLATPLVRAQNLGDIDVRIDNKTLPVSVTASSTELQNLARLAFNAHGRYDASGRRAPAFEIRFTLTAPNQVRVDVTKGGAAFASDSATGANAKQALLRAADIAVVKTNGQNLRGFFASQLVFISEVSGKKEIYTSDLFMSDVMQRTTDRALVLTPRWSPDGRKFLFTSYKKSGAPDVFQYDMNPPYQVTTFVSYKGTNSGARFSPTGQQVAMILTGEGTPEIYVSDAQGRGVARKTPRSEAVKSSPVWSPDGSQIVFAMEPGPQLYVMSAAGGAPRRLSSGFTYVAEPDWSRASNKIACTVRGAGGRYQIAIMPAAGGALQAIDTKDFDAIEPSWLPDGRHLVYTARDRRSSVLCILDTETGRSTRISPANLGAAMQANVWAGP